MNGMIAYLRVSHHYSLRERVLPSKRLVSHSLLVQYSLWPHYNRGWGAPLKFNRSFETGNGKGDRCQPPTGGDDQGFKVRGREAEMK